MTVFPPKWMIFIVASWLLMSFTFAVLEGAWVGSGEQTAITQITTSRLFTAEDISGKIVGAFSGQLWSGILKMATFNYGMLNQPGWELFHWFVLFPLSALAIFSAVYATARLIRGGG